MQKNLLRFLLFSLFSLSTLELASEEQSAHLPFNYDLHLNVIPGKSTRVLILLHGYGANYQIGETLKKIHSISTTLVSFNFPDHDLHKRNYDPHRASFGTIEELLPALYVLKKYVVDEGREVIDLYGYSAGGGALINLLAILNTKRYETSLEQIGIALQERKQILQAIQKGIVILDVPLKSIEEIIALRGASSELEILAKNYQTHRLRPIDSLELLEGLTLDMILHFQKNDEVLFNRDDALYIQKLKRANARGTTSVIIEDEGGHTAPHLSLWKLYAQKLL